MADAYRARANRPTSAVEKTRNVREGGGVLRPSSAGVWRGKPQDRSWRQSGDSMNEEESATSRSSASESSQNSSAQALRDRVSRAGLASRTSSASSSSSKQNRKKSASDVWMVAPMAPPSGRHSWEDERHHDHGSKVGRRGGGVAAPGATHGRAVSSVTAERLRKLSRLPIEKDRNRLQQLEESLQAAEAKGGRSTQPYLDVLERLGRHYNTVAMQYLQQGEHRYAIRAL